MTFLISLPSGIEGQTFVDFGYGYNTLKVNNNIRLVKFPYNTGSDYFNITVWNIRWASGTIIFLFSFEFVTFFRGDSRDMEYH